MKHTARLLILAAATAALALPSCITYPDGSKGFDWNAAGNATVNVIGAVANARSASRAPGPFTATK